MKNRGYTPWVAKKAPLFNKSLNETYIRLNAVFLVVIFMFAFGVLSGFLMPSQLSVVLGGKTYSVSKDGIETVEPKVVSKPILTTKIEKPLPIKPQVADPMMVPAIPMATVPEIPHVAIEDMLQKDYQLTMYEATTYVNAAKQASARTGIEPSLLLAIAAETSKFKIYDGNQFVGIMGVNTGKYPEIIKTLKSEGISYITAEGGFILGAEVMKKYLATSNNDINAAVAKFMGRGAGDPSLDKTLQLKINFESALK
jgi:hypothetical protein